MTRLPDWPERLNAEIERAQGASLVWGQHDCCTWAANVVMAMTGTDPIADLRGSWQSASEAARVLRQLGGLQAALCARLGQPLPGLAHAQRGDVVLLATGPRLAAGVCVGAVALAPAEVGLARVPMWLTPAHDVHPLLAWRI